MKIEVKKLDKIRRILKIEVKGDEFLKEKKQTYQEAAKHLKVPGFRPGNVPLELLEKHHGKTLKEELARKIVPHFYRRALEQEKVIPAGLPRIFDVEIDTEALNFSAEVEVRPELELKESSYKGIKIKDTKVDIKDQEIENFIVKVKDEVKKVLGQDVDDADVARWASYPSLELFKKAIRAQLSVEKLQERRQNIDSQLRKQLLKEFKADLPKGEIERHHKELVDRELYQLQVQGIPQADIDKYRNDVEDKVKPMAENDVRLFYVLEAIAKKESIKIDNNIANAVFGYILSQASFEE